MKKNKKIKFKNNNCIDELNLNQIISLINNSLIYERYLNYKKENNLPLSSVEQVIDSCLLPPSILLKYIGVSIK